MSSPFTTRFQAVTPNGTLTPGFQRQMQELWDRAGGANVGAVTPPTISAPISAPSAQSDKPAFFADGCASTQTAIFAR